MHFQAVVVHHPTTPSAHTADRMMGSVQQCELWDGMSKPSKALGASTQIWQYLDLEASML